MGQKCQFHRAVRFVAIAALIGVVSTARADLFINFPPVTVFSNNVDPVNGELLVVLGVTGSGPQISTYNLDFTTDGVGLSFGTPEKPTVNPLFPFSSGMFTTPGTTATNVKAYRDILPSSVAAFDGAELLKVPFTIAPGHVGTTYHLDLNPVLTEMADESGNAYSLMLQQGTVFVAIVPEVAAWKGLGLVAMSCAVALLLRRRKLAPA